MKRIEVRLGARSYPVFLGEGLLERSAELAIEATGARRAIVVTDANVARHGLHLRTGFAGEPIVLPAGEATKSWDQAGRLLQQLLERNLGRDDIVVALGGGMIGDIAGFAAAVLKRGCRYVQIPTTLLAQADSSVGGKTAVNLPQGKNLVGAFHQPTAVIVDPAALATLPQRELRAGYAEVVKYGLIADPGFYDWCEAKAARLLRRDTETLLHAAETGIRAKAAIVAEDEEDRVGRRALLNFGHTFGHALEAETGFSDDLLHGEAVAIGMLLAFRFSVRRGLCAAEEAERVKAHFEKAGLPTRIPFPASGQRLALHMAQDKKNFGGRTTFVLTRGIGRAFLDQSVELSEVAEFLDEELS